MEEGRPSTQQIVRRSMLTETDLNKIAALLQEMLPPPAQHACRFENVTPEEMAFVKDLIDIYKETRSEVIKWIVRGAVSAIMLLILISGWMKYGKKFGG